MYIPAPFKVNDDNETSRFIENNAFGQLISNSDGRLVSTHLPFLLSDDKTKLVAHLAKQNPQTQDIEGQEVLVSLQGPHGYISPSWYLELGVPTWDYQAAHVYGYCKTFTEHDALKQLVDALTNKYEATQESPWQPEYNTNMLKAIVGIEIEITEIQCKYKLSQNRSKEDQANVIEQLKQQGSNQLAKAMQSNDV